MISAAVQYWPSFLRGIVWVATSWWFALIASTVCLLLWWFLSRKEKSFAAVTFEDAIILPNPDGSERIVHKPSIDQKVAQWIEARFPRRVVLVDDRYHFGFEVQVPQRVMIRRTKNRPRYITILNKIGMTDEQRTELKRMPDQARESLFRAINLESSRYKLEPHFDQDFRYACLHHDILITPELTESRLIDGINDVKFAHSVIHHTINNLLTPPLARELAGRQEDQSLLEIEAIATPDLQNPTQRGFDSDNRPPWSLDLQIAVRNRHLTESIDDVTVRILDISPVMVAYPRHKPRTQDATLRRIQFQFDDIALGKPLLGGQAGHVRILHATKFMKFMEILEGVPSNTEVHVSFLGKWPDSIEKTEFIAAEIEYVLTVEVAGRGVQCQSAQFVLRFSSERRDPVMRIEKIEPAPTSIKNDQAIAREECLDCATKVLKKYGKAVESFYAICACDISKLRNNEDVIWVCDQLKLHHHEHPFELVESYVPRHDWLDFIKWAGRMPFQTLTRGADYLQAAEDWRIEHNYPDPPDDIHVRVTMLKTLLKRTVTPPSLTPDKAASRHLPA